MMDKAKRLMRGVVLKLMPGHITCAEFEAFIAEYFEGDLPEAKRKVFDLHLTICEECRAYLKAYKNTIALGQAAFRHADAAVPEDMPEDLVKAILAARKAGSSQS